MFEPHVNKLIPIIRVFFHILNLKTTLETFQLVDAELKNV
jgi:hypothetical protein